MKKLFLIIMLILLATLLSSNELFAGSSRSYPAQNYLNFSWFLRPASLGFKTRLFNNVYATGNLDYIKSIGDLELQAGAVYMFPVKILIFKLYAGGGYQFSRNEGFQYPYATVGTNFWVFFTEAVYPIDSRIDPKYRFGLSIKF
jgi:hypothetical protein